LAEVPAGRKPDWLRVAAPDAPAYRSTEALLRELRVSTVCRESRCPNKGECFSARTASLLILGTVCTRACRFCAVGTAGQGEEGATDRDDQRPLAGHERTTAGAGRPAAGGRRRPMPAGRAQDATRAADGGAGLVVDADEPQRVAAAVSHLALRHVVLTSVTRDDLPDGGAQQFADTVRAVREAAPQTTVEVLIPDLQGDQAALDSILAARPDVLAHNLETVPRLTPQVRSRALYERSLALLQHAADLVRDKADGASARGAPRALVKTGLMLGLGERDDEVRAVLTDCAAAGVEVVTIGQYLQPRRGCLPVARYVTPDEFAHLQREGEAMGLSVAAGPFVRSSYRAGDLIAARRHGAPA
jgi:lipoic acid synthetase